LIIGNTNELISKGNSSGRKIILDIIESAIEHANFYSLLRERIRIDGALRIDSLYYDLETIDEIFVVGAGKNVSFVAAAVEEILGDRISEGAVVEKRGWGRKTKKIVVLEGGHPLPDEGSVRGAQNMINIADKADEDDLVIACVTGGCTSLLALPPDEITLDETRETFELLLKSGATVEEMNAVRKHLSRTAGGKLSVILHPAEILSLIGVDEVVGRPWGPTVPDTTYFADAIRVLKRYDLWDSTPKSVRTYFENADPRHETPKVDDFDRMGIRNQNVIFANNEMLCRAAETRAKELGVSSAILTTRLEGEARDVAIVLMSIAKEISTNARPFAPPCVLIIGGETTVTIRGESGVGGRNQELSLAAAIEIAGDKNVVIASIGTDGTDGPTNVAGAIVDGYTMDQIKRQHVDPFQALKMHNSSFVFSKLGDAIRTDDTGTNLMDLVLVYVGTAEIK